MREAAGWWLSGGTLVAFALGALLVLGVHQASDSPVATERPPPISDQTGQVWSPKAPNVAKARPDSDEKNAQRPAEPAPPRDFTGAFDFLPPDPPDQLLSCGERAFVQLGRQQVQVFRTSDFYRLARFRVEDSRAVAALAGSSYLIVTGSKVLRYYYGQPRAESFAKVPLLGPSELIADPDHVQRFHLRYVRDPAVHRFDLGDEETVQGSEAGSPPPKKLAIRLGETTELERFDGKALIRLRDGHLLFTSGTELIRRSAVARSLPWPRLGGELVLLAADTRLDRYWAFSREGEAVLTEFSRGYPVVRRLELGGMPYAVEVERDRLAAIVLSRAQGFQAGTEPTDAGAGSLVRRWSLKVFQRGQQMAEWKLPDRSGMAGDWIQQVMGNRDLCLIPNQPWVLQGGRDQVTVYNYRTGAVMFSSRDP